MRARIRAASLKVGALDGVDPQAPTTAEGVQVGLNAGLAAMTGGPEAAAGVIGRAAISAIFGGGGPDPVLVALAAPKAELDNLYSNVNDMEATLTNFVTQQSLVDYSQAVSGLSPLLDAIDSLWTSYENMAEAAPASARDAAIEFQNAMYQDSAPDLSKRTLMFGGLDAIRDAMVGPEGGVGSRPIASWAWDSARGSRKPEVLTTVGSVPLKLIARKTAIQGISAPSSASTPPRPATRDTTAMESSCRPITAANTTRC